MAVSAVVVTFNRLTLLKENINHLLNQSLKLDKIFIVNNNSNDGTTEFLNNLKNDDIVVKNLSKNIGGAGGFNLGLKYAYQESSSEFFWIMDDDTMPDNNALNQLIISANELKNDFGFLCSNVRWWKDYSPCNVPSVSDDWTKMSKESMIKITNATFVSILIKRKSLNDIGLPIKDTFIWGDDTEFTLRLSRYNESSYFVINSNVIHKSKTNVSTETIYECDKNRILFYKYMYRNLLYIDRKYYSKNRFLKDIIRFSKDAILIPFKSKNYKILRILYMFSGIFNGFFFNPKIEHP